jgi:NTE family protein
MKTGLFLTPGAARTAYYVGALDVLIRESGIHFDVIAGSSVGALNGAFAAMDETRQLIEIWKNWTTEDVMVNDYKALLQGGFFWASHFASNEPEYETGVRDYIFEDKIQDGVTFRFNIADISTGTNRILTYPGEEVPIQKGIMAAVSVPVLFEPVEIDGHQYVDGLAIEGCPLESLILQTGVDRVFVLGVSPRSPLENPTKNAYTAMLSASEWNQYTEPFYAIQQAEEENAIIRAWQKERESLKRLIDSSDITAAEKTELTELLETAYAENTLPYNRQPVDIHSVMPQHPIEMWFGEFLPSRSKKLMDMGRQDALHLLEKIPV